MDDGEKILSMFPVCQNHPLMKKFHPCMKSSDEGKRLWTCTDQYVGLVQLATQTDRQSDR